MAPKEKPAIFKITATFKGDNPSGLPPTTVENKDPSVQEEMEGSEKDEDDQLTIAVATGLSHNKTPTPTLTITIAPGIGLDDEVSVHTQTSEVELGTPRSIVDDSSEDGSILTQVSHSSLGGSSRTYNPEATPRSPHPIVEIKVADGSRSNSPKSDVPSIPSSNSSDPHDPDLDPTHSLAGSRKDSQKPDNGDPKPPASNHLSPKATLNQPATEDLSRKLLNQGDPFHYALLKKGSSRNYNLASEQHQRYFPKPSHHKYQALAEFKNNLSEYFDSSLRSAKKPLEPGIHTATSEDIATIPLVHSGDRSHAPTEVAPKTADPPKTELSLKQVKENGRAKKITSEKLSQLIVGTKKTLLETTPHEYDPDQHKEMYIKEAIGHVYKQKYQDSKAQEKEYVHAFEQRLKLYENSKFKNQGSSAHTIENFSYTEPNKISSQLEVVPFFKAMDPQQATSSTNPSSIETINITGRLNNPNSNALDQERFKAQMVDTVKHHSKAIKNPVATVIFTDQNFELALEIVLQMAAYGVKTKLNFTSLDNPTSVPIAHILTDRLHKLQSSKLIDQLKGLGIQLGAPIEPSTLEKKLTNLANDSKKQNQFTNTHSRQQDLCPSIKRGSQS